VAAQTPILAATSLLLSPLDAASTMRALRQSLRRAVLARQCRQFALFRIIEYDRNSST
jgi:hypothetical protein